MKLIRLIFLLLLLAAAAVVVTGRYVLPRGLSSREQPSPAEAFVARRLRRMAIPNRAREVKNPVQGNPEVLSRATAHFADHCANCHGNDGRGNTLIGRGLYPKPPDMTQSATQELTDGEIYYIIENGIRFTGMPAFGEQSENDNDQESWDLVHLIRRLPQMTAEEVERMKEMNPKSPSELAKEEEIRRFLQGDDTAPAETNHEHHH